MVTVFFKLQKLSLVTYSAVQNIFIKNLKKTGLTCGFAALLLRRSRITSRVNEVVLDLKALQELEN